DIDAGGATEVDGGAGTDSLTLHSVGGPTVSSAGITGMETIHIISNGFATVVLADVTGAAGTTLLVIGTNATSINGSAEMDAHLSMYGAILTGGALDDDLHGFDDHADTFRGG